MNVHEQFMKRALFLAQLGLEHTAPNPMVGAVITLNGKIIGEGYHERCGEGHAEVNAIKQVEDLSVLKHATMYVTLEPCAHFGKTPPCADLLIRHQLKTVYIAMQDPFSEVAGKGIERLRNAGIDVHVGLLEQEARALNKRFLTFHTLKRPYIILKWAQSQDGFMDVNRTSEDKGIHWITQPETQCLTHQWRAEEAAILVGVQTVLTDNPSLTTRSYAGKNPKRFVLDPNKRLTGTELLLQDNAETVVFTRELPTHPSQVQLFPYTLETLCNYLYQQNINSLIVEGGKHTLTQFIDQNLWDEARILTGEVYLSDGLTAPKIQGKQPQHTFFGKDKLHIIQKL